MRTPHRALLSTFIVLTGCQLEDDSELDVDGSSLLVPGDTEPDVATVYDPASEMAIEIPPSGLTSTMTVRRKNGASKMMRVANNNGVVTTTYGATAAAGGAGSNVCLPTDNQYKTLSHKWTSPYAWSFNYNGRSPELIGIDAVQAKTAITAAADTITKETNDCGFSDNVSASHTPQGNTSLKGYLRYKRSQDGAYKIACKKAPTDWQTNTAFRTNVIDFSIDDDSKWDMPDNVLAVTCTWHSNNAAISSDIRINSHHRWFTGATVPAGCSGVFHLESVMAHELGHAYGLDHPNVEEPSLTMNYYSSACTTYQATLNRGDAKGLETLY